MFKHRRGIHFLIISVSLNALLASTSQANRFADMLEQHEQEVDQTERQIADEVRKEEAEFEAKKREQERLQKEEEQRQAEIRAKNEEIRAHNKRCRAWRDRIDRENAALASSNSEIDRNNAKLDELKARYEQALRDRNAAQQRVNSACDPNFNYFCDVTREMAGWNRESPSKIDQARDDLIWRTRNLVDNHNSRLYRHNANIDKYNRECANDS